MKNTFKIKNLFVLGLLAALPGMPAMAQDILPENAHPVIFSPDQLALDFQERFVKCNVTANVSFTIEKTDSTAKWLSLYKNKDGKLYLHIQQNKEMTPRKTILSITNNEKGLKEFLEVQQGGDMTVYPEDYMGFSELLINDFMASFTTKDDSTNNKQAFDHFDPKTGKFDDVNYADRSRTNWDPDKHLNRLGNLVKSYINPKGKYYQDDEAYNNIVKMFEYWHAVNPNSNNWWFNQICEPQKLGQAMVMMLKGKKQLPANLQNNILARMATEGGNPQQQAGANRVDVAIHWMYQGILLQDEKKLKYAVNMIYDPVRYTTGEGFQHDGSYLQHGPQLYIGSYGVVTVNSILNVARNVEITKFACLGKSRSELLSKFVRETYYKVTRGRSICYSLMGRAITRPGSTRIGPEMAQMMMLFDKPEYKQEYQDIIARSSGEKPANYNIKPVNTHYYRGDYTVHVRPEYTFDVRMASTRVNMLEDDSGNQENYFGHYLSFGSNNIMRTGEEYYRIFPLWNWNRIPGTTATEKIPTPGPWRRGFGTFCGAVSDSLYGATGYDFYDTYQSVNTGGKKSWFFFDDEVVCLGLVKSDSPLKATTTLNQCWNGTEQPVYKMGDQNKTLNMGDSILVENPKWVFHNKIGYVFPQGGNVCMASQKKVGDTNHINHTCPKDTVVGEVFTINLEHGIKPVDMPYAYYVVPTVNTPKELEDYCSKQAIEIVENSKNVQSVYHKGLKIWEIIFYEPGKITHNGVTIETSRRCALLFKEVANGKHQLHVADPCQTQQMVTVNVTLSDGQTQKVSANFAGTGIHAGKSKAFMLN